MKTKVFLVLFLLASMLRPASVFAQSDTITKELEVNQVGFPNALPNQRTCVNFTWPSGSDSSYIDSGWFIGDSLAINLNGNPVAYEILPKTGIAYDFEVKKDFSNPQGVLQICTTRSSGGTEIGLRAD